MASVRLATGQPRRARWKVDLDTTQPGTPGGIFMRQFWHAVGRGDDLPRGRAVPLRIMGEDYTLYRGMSGKAQILGRELRLIAEGRQPRQWQRPPKDVIPLVGVKLDRKAGAA